jgi:hypothetical protein
MNPPFDLMIKIIKASEECKEYLEREYSHEFGVYERFSKRNGPGCAFARAGLRRIFFAEHQKRGSEFLGALGSETWGSKEYQGGSSQ